jgi:HSP20 family molecular chaperone IbpA
MSRMTLLNGAVWLGHGTEDSAASPGSRPVAGKSRQDGYPPFNVERLPETPEAGDALRITLAVAGFAREELDVTVGEGQLVVSGQQAEDPNDTRRDYLHRGIAARQFKRSFGLADGVEVCKAELHHGLLTIELRRLRKVEPVRKVGIVAGDQE